jgi:hypothetical protein
MSLADADVDEQVCAPITIAAGVDNVIADRSYAEEIFSTPIPIKLGANDNNLYLNLATVGTPTLASGATYKVKILVKRN